MATSACHVRPSNLHYHFRWIGLMYTQLTKSGCEQDSVKCRHKFTVQQIAHLLQVLVGAYWSAAFQLHDNQILLHQMLKKTICANLMIHKRTCKYLQCTR